jgi:hypothetical protein
MTYVKATLDGNYYLVRDLSDKLIAANMLAKIKQDIFNLVAYLDKNKEKFKEYDLYIDRLKNRIKNVNISENTGRGSDTSYSINKGDELVLCLRSKISYQFHDLNLIVYVMLHEISHIASPKYEEEYNNHGPLFKKIFNFMTTSAIDLGMYNKIDFDKQPMEYCGMHINKSIS